jgi:hypothetical protein
MILSSFPDMDYHFIFHCFSFCQISRKSSPWLLAFQYPDFLTSLHPPPSEMVAGGSIGLRLVYTLNDRRCGQEFTLRMSQQSTTPIGQRKPRFEIMGQGPNAEKSGNSEKKMLSDDLDRILKFIQEPDDFKDVPIGDDSDPPS